MAESGADALGIDWQTDLADARKRVGGRVALQETSIRWRFSLRRQ
jgi:uroporphyrinogen decarboxylase